MNIRWLKWNLSLDDFVHCPFHVNYLQYPLFINKAPVCASDPLRSVVSPQAKGVWRVGLTGEVKPCGVYLCEEGELRSSPDGWSV